MKVKLLKRVRKEFSINHYPDGVQKQEPGFVRTAIIQPSNKYGPNTYTLEHKGVVLSSLDLSKQHVNKTPQQIYNDLRNLLVFHINRIYGDYGTRRLNKVKQQQSPKKLWYKSI